MKLPTLHACALAAALLPLATAANSFATAITEVRVYSSSSTGVWDGVDLWNTDPGDAYYNLGVYQNMQSLRAGPTDAGASVNIPISLGTSTFEFAASQGSDAGHFDIQLFMNNAPLPQLSVIVAESFPNAVTGAFVASTLGGATYTTGGVTYSVQSFQWLAPTVDSADVVGQYGVGQDHSNDFIGVLTIDAAPATSVTPPGAPEPASLGLLALGGAALLRRRKR